MVWDNGGAEDEASIPDDAGRESVTDFVTEGTGSGPVEVVVTEGVGTGSAVTTTVVSFDPPTMTGFPWVSAVLCTGFDDTEVEGTVEDFTDVVEERRLLLADVLVSFDVILSFDRLLLSFLFFSLPPVFWSIFVAFTVFMAFRRVLPSFEAGARAVEVEEV